MAQMNVLPEGLERNNQRHFHFAMPTLEPGQDANHTHNLVVALGPNRMGNGWRNFWFFVARLRLVNLVLQLHILNADGHLDAFTLALRAFLPMQLLFLGIHNNRPTIHPHANPFLRRQWNAVVIVAGPA